MLSGRFQTWTQLLPPHVWQASVLLELPKESQAAFRQTSKVRHSDLVHPTPGAEALHLMSFTSPIAVLCDETQGRAVVPAQAFGCTLLPVALLGVGAPQQPR